MKGFVKILGNIVFWPGLILIIALWLAQPLAVLVLLIPFVIWLLISRQGNQALTVAWTGISTLPHRLGATSVIVIGIAGVVGVLVALLSMAEGFEATLKQTGNEDTAIIIRAGATAELNSGLSRDSVILIKQVDGVVRDANDKPLASAETVVVSNVPKKSTGTDANVEVRGVSPEVWDVRPNVNIIQGKRFTSGLHEVVVGKGALNEFAGLEPGSRVELTNQSWTVVGVFESGDAHDSEIWADVETLNAAVRRNAYQSVTMRLVSPEVIEEIEAKLTADPRLNVEVQTTLAYYTKQSEQLTKAIRIIGIAVSVIMAIGAVFGALNTMYSAVAARAREIATLRALGFTNLPVVVAILLETMLLALLGGVIGAMIAHVLFNDYTASTLGANFSQVVFEFQVTPQLLMNGLQWALAIGFVGGLFPALHAARLPVTVALKEQ